MDIRVRKQGKINILDVTGRLTSGGDAVLREKVRDLLGAGEQNFILNLVEVPFIDSVGLGETVACTKRICDRGGTIKVVLAERGKVQEVLEITGLSRAYEIFHDEQEALASWMKTI